MAYSFQGRVNLYEYKQSHGLTLDDITKALPSVLDDDAWRWFRWEYCGKTASWVVRKWPRKRFCHGLEKGIPLSFLFLILIILYPVMDTSITNVV